MKKIAFSALAVAFFVGLPAAASAQMVPGTNTPCNRYYGQIDDARCGQTIQTNRYGQNVAVPTGGNNAVYQNGWYPPNGGYGYPAGYPVYYDSETNGGHTKTDRNGNKWMYCRQGQSGPGGYVPMGTVCPSYGQYHSQSIEQAAQSQTYSPSYNNQPSGGGGYGSSSSYNDGDYFVTESRDANGNLVITRTHR